MKRREFLIFVGSVMPALRWPLAAQAQGMSKVRRIGFLRVGPPPAAWIEALRQGLRELGHIEGQNIAIEFGAASSTAELSDIAAKLVQLKVDVIFASGTLPLLVAKDAAGDPGGLRGRHRSSSNRDRREPCQPRWQRHRPDQHPSGYYGETSTAFKRAASQPLKTRGYGTRNQSG